MITIITTSVARLLAPREGPAVVRVAQQHYNGWWGSLQFNVYKIDSDRSLRIRNTSYCHLKKKIPAQWVD